ncbi:hypothetical protein T03_9972 [Trichinella britovi]|uniref:DUF5641 domain-containing protein n=1 Tax=Trichinella britovi TaxID=45882 RepID=A0A0V1C8B9_TRIBR|nr:hypothetical protein T03_9972 [Trichinella britovi]
MKIETGKRRQQIEQKRLRETILQVLDQLETDSAELAVRNALRALDAQYAEAHRAQVTLEDLLHDGESLEAVLDEWRELCKEVFTTRTRADTFLKGKDESKEPMATPALTEKSGSKSQLGKLKPVPLPKFDDNILEFKSFWDQFEVNIDRREDIGAITKFLHLRSYAPQSIPSSAEVVESHVLKVVSLKECSDDGAADLTRLHDDLNRHFLELRALGKDVDANLSGFHALLPIIKKKLPPDTLEAWRAFVQGMTNEKITSSVFLSFLLNQSRIKGPARKIPPRKPERRFEQQVPYTLQVDPLGNCVVCCGIHPVESCPRFVELSGPERWQCVLDVCEKGTVEVAASRILIDQVSTLCFPQRTPTVVRTADEPGAVKEKNPTTAPAQGLKAEDAASDRAATELAPVGVHFSSTVRAPGVLLPVVQAMAYGENGKKRLVNCLLDSASEKSLIRTNVADELELSGTPSAVTVRGVHGLSARVADSRQVRFQLGQAHEEIAVSTKLELTGLCIPSIPHSVYQHNQGKTKCRVVFDGSAEWNGTSLNNCLDPGPNIEKMYLQVGLRPEDRDVCRYLWQERDCGAPVKVYRLTRVGFGLTCSPFLAMQVVRHHAPRCGNIDALTDRVLSDMYVDDLATSCDGVDEARHLVQRLTELMKTGGFALKKWASNDRDALMDLPPEDVPSAGEDRLWKTLGCLALFTIRAKKLFQSLCLKGLDWDDQLPLDINSVWCQWKRELETLDSVRVPRALMVIPKGQVRRSELHVFGDASETAFGAVAYLMTESMDGANEVRFCLAKTRVALVKRLSLPRLELMAALHVARLKEYVERELGLLFNRSTCWSDSTIVLSWIRGDPRRWKPFVANRIQEILSRTEPSQWRHCPTADNPADKLSLGCPLDTLREDKLWWNGPAWLKEPMEQWPRLIMALSPEETRLVSPERKRVFTLCASLQEPSLLMIIDPSRYGTMERLVRVTAYCCRFLANARTHAGERKIRAQLSLLELQDAEKRWVRAVQAEAFPISKTASGPIPVPAGDPLAALSPFVDTEGLLRLIVRRTHEAELHAGLNQTLAALRRRFWHDARPFCPLMSDLPPERVTSSFPFNRVGLDFAGPLHVKDEHRPAQKAYICLFTCMVTRAVHLEVAFDMTTISFLATLRRFIARRGRPSQADSFLRDLLRGKSAGKIREELAMRQIEWKSMKNALRKVLGKALLRSWELHTVLCELEARINDRPLTLLSEDPHDCAPLTPAHFLIGRELASFPIPAASTSAPTNASSLQYLVTLTSRGKWTKIGRQPEKGDLVFLVEEGVPRNCWKLGVITKPLTGSDGVTRSAKVRTAFSSG